MRTCSAGVVRPLSSPASQPSQAVAPSTSSPLSSAAATVSNEPVMENTFGVEGLAQAEDMVPSGASNAMGRSKADDNHQSQLPAGTRTRRTRKAAKTAIDAALQTLADVQVGVAQSSIEGCASIPCRGSFCAAHQQFADDDKVCASQAGSALCRGYTQVMGVQQAPWPSSAGRSGQSVSSGLLMQAEAGGRSEATAAGSVRSPKEAMLKEAVQERLKASAAQPAAGQGHSRQSKRSLARETLKSPGRKARATMVTAAASQSVVNGDGELRNDVVPAPVTPEYQLRLRQRRIQH